VPVEVKPAGDNTTSLTFRSDRTTFDEPGRYTGSLPLGPGRSAPRVGLVAEVQWWWGWAVLAVVFGVFVGRMVPPLLTKERRRRKGRDAIKDAVARFGALRRGHERPASRDLDDLITPLHWKFRGLFVRPQDKVTRVLRDLDESTADPELKDAVNAALKLRDDVDNWAVVERPARELLDLLDRPMPERAGDRTFAATDAHKEANGLRLALQDDPPHAPAKLARVAEQETGLLRLAQEVWILQDRLDRCVLPAKTQVVREEQELEVVGPQKGSDPFARTVNDLNALESALKDAVACLTGLERKFAPAMQPSGRRLDPLERTLKRIVWLGRRLDIAAWHALTRFRRLLWGWIQGAHRRIVTRVRGWLAVAEGLSLLASLALPAIVYVLTLYTDTWGTPLDFASALGVGFAGKLAIDLGASGLSIRGAPAGDASSTAEAGEAGEAAVVEQPETVAANGDRDREDPTVPARLDLGPVAPTGSTREMKLLISGVPVLITWPGDEPQEGDQPKPPLPPSDEPQLLG
jgi:hypothetical protein